MRAIKRWQAAHPGNDLRWPDHADLVVWLMEQLSWQPIDTAPKDGTKVDLWFPHTGREIDWEWADEDPFDPPQWIHRGKENVTTYPNQTPTHWRHVPVMPHDPAPR